ncbi:hypothetical protein RCL1_003492 [Eukaryota sp. TZLM3-RCL]
MPPFEDLSAVTPLETLSKQLYIFFREYLAKVTFPTCSFASEFTWQSYELRVVFIIDTTCHNRFLRWYGTTASIILGLSTKNTPNLPYTHVNALPTSSLVSLFLSALSLAVNDSNLFALSFPSSFSLPWGLSSSSPSLSLLVPVKSNQFACCFTGVAYHISSSHSSLKLLDSNIISSLRPPTLSDLWIMLSSEAHNSSPKTWADGYCISTPLNLNAKYSIFESNLVEKDAKLSVKIFVRIVFNTKPYKHYNQSSNFDCFDYRHADLYSLKIDQSILNQKGQNTTFLIALKNLLLSLHDNPLIFQQSLRKFASRKWKTLISIVNNTLVESFEIFKSSAQNFEMSTPIKSIPYSPLSIFLFLTTHRLLSSRVFESEIDFNLLIEALIYSWFRFIEFLTANDEVAQCFRPYFNNFTVNFDFSLVWQYLHLFWISKFSNNNFSGNEKSVLIRNGEQVMRSDKSGPIYEPINDNSDLFSLFTEDQSISPLSRQLSDTMLIQSKMIAFLEVNIGATLADFSTIFSTKFLKKRPSTSLLNSCWHTVLAQKGQKGQNNIDRMTSSEAPLVWLKSLGEKLNQSNEINQKLIYFVEEIILNLISTVLTSIEKDFISSKVIKKQSNHLKNLIENLIESRPFKISELDKIIKVFQNLESMICVCDSLNSNFKFSCEFFDELLQTTWFESNTRWLNFDKNFCQFFAEKADWNNEEAVREFLLLRNDLRYYAVHSVGYLRICKKFEL